MKRNNWKPTAIGKKRLAEGMTNGILFSIKNLMETLGLTIEQAMAALKIPDTEKQKYMEHRHSLPHPAHQGTAL